MATCSCLSFILTYHSLTCICLLNSPLLLCYVFFFSLKLCRSLPLFIYSWADAMGREVIPMTSCFHCDVSRYLLSSNLKQISYILNCRPILVRRHTSLHSTVRALRTTQVASHFQIGIVSFDVLSHVCRQDHRELRKTASSKRLPVHCCHGSW